MNKIYLIISLVFTVGLGLGFSVNVSGEESLIPSWIKNTAGFWVDGKIGDREFIQALQYLVEKDILRIPSTKPVEQIQSYNELHYVDAQIIRDCSRETEIFAENYMSKIVNLDSISLEQEEQIQNNVERISICNADIREIEAREYGTGSVTGYWELMSRLQSLFDQVCDNTGKLCGYVFHGP